MCCDAVHLKKKKKKIGSSLIANFQAVQSASAAVECHLRASVPL